MPANNPIIPGDHPDPSIVRVDEDYYLVTSTFQYFPGIALFHSHNLVDWRSLGYVLTRDTQLDLRPVADSAGVWAADISYLDGEFTVAYTLQCPDEAQICTVTTRDPEGPWSDPNILIRSRRHSDPSIFNDDDGRRYLLTANGLIQELSKDGKNLIGEEGCLWQGSGDDCPEGPHLFKHRGYYYLMMAEGGTFYGHREVLARSPELHGPYEACPHNPILCAPNENHPIQKAGHGKFVEAPNGDWWMTYLAARPREGQHCPLGRETFLSRVTWNQAGWPVVDPPHLEIDEPIQTTKSTEDKEDLFQTWQSTRNPSPNAILTDASERKLEIKNAEYSRRLDRFSAHFASTLKKHSPQGSGVSVFTDTQTYCRLMRSNNGLELEINRGAQIERLSFEDSGNTFRIDINDMKLQFFVKDREEWKPLGDQIPMQFLSPESIRAQKRKCFTGCRIGCFDLGDGAIFEDIEYRPL